LLKDSKLNVFGDSYSTVDFQVSPKESFWGVAAADLKIDNITNYSHPGFSFDAILHIIINETFDFENDYFLIGIPPLHRYIGYSDTKDTKWTATQFKSTNLVKKISVNSLDNTLPFKFEEQFKNDKNGIDRFNREWLDIQFLEKIFLLHQYLTQNNAKFLILNLTIPIVYQDMWPAGQSIMRKVDALKECVIFQNTYYSVNYNDNIKPADFDQYGWFGHHGPEGNLNWYNKIVKNKMIELNWINNA
jgi:hypothetical protein